MNQAVLLVAILIAVFAFGIYRASVDGKFRASKNKLPVFNTNPYLPKPGERFTLVQFSSSFCAPCRQTKAQLERIASSVPGVVHIEIDAESNLELVREFDIIRTPTTLVLNSKSEIVSRVSGVPRQSELLKILASQINYDL